MRYLPVLGAVISEGELRKSRGRVRITEYSVRSTEDRVRSTDYGVPITEYRLRSTDYGVPITEYRLRSTDYRGRIKPFSVISTLDSVLDLVLPNLFHAGTVHWLASGGFEGVRGFGRGEAGAQGIGPRVHLAGAVSGGIGKLA